VSGNFENPKGSFGKKSIGGLYFEINSDLIINKRSIYNVLDFLGDVGGLREALLAIGQLVLLLCGQSSLSGYLVSKVFQTPGPRERAGIIEPGTWPQSEVDGA